MLFFSLRNVDYESEHMQHEKDNDSLHHEMQYVSIEWVRHDFDHFIEFSFVERLFLKDFRFV